MDMSAGIFNPREYAAFKAPKAMMSLQQMIGRRGGWKGEEVIKSWFRLKSQLGIFVVNIFLDNGESLSCHCFYVAILSGNNRIHGCFTADKGNFSVPKVVEVVHNWLHHLSVIRTYAGELAVGFFGPGMQLEYGILQASKISESTPSVRMMPAHRLARQK